MSHKNPACPSNSNICERDRAKDVEQFDDILRTFINETSKFENRIGEIRVDETMLAFGKLIDAWGLLNIRFRGTTLNYEELLIALENIMVIIDKVPTDPTTRQKNVDHRILDIALQSTGELGRVQAGKFRSAQVARMQISEGKVDHTNATGRREAKEQGKVSRPTAGHAGPSRTHSSFVPKGRHCMRRKLRSEKKHLTRGRIASVVSVGRE